MRLLSHDLYWRNKKYKLKRSIFALFVCIGQRNVLEKCDCKLVVSLIMAKFSQIMAHSLLCTRNAVCDWCACVQQCLLLR